MPVLIEDPLQLVETFRHVAKRGKPEPVRIARPTLVEARLVAHADEHAVVNRAGGESCQRHGSAAMAQALSC